MLRLKDFHLCYMVPLTVDVAGPPRMAAAKERKILQEKFDVEKGERKSKCVSNAQLPKSLHPAKCICFLPGAAVMTPFASRTCNTIIYEGAAAW